MACATRSTVAVRRQMRSAHPIGSLLSGGLDSSSVSVLAARALAEKNERLAAFTGVPRRGFDGTVPNGAYADETPYVDAIQKSGAGTIDVTYVRNDEYDDFGELERFFVALDGPVRNPTNLGWMLGVLRLARAQGRRVLLGGLYGNSTISWNGWSQAAGHLKRGRLLTAARQWRQFYRRTPYSRWVAMRKLFIEPLTPRRLGDWAERRRRPPASRPGTITPRSAPISPPRSASTPAPKTPDMIFFIACGRTNACAAWRRSIMPATGTRPRRPSPASRCATRPPTWMCLTTASAFRPSSISPKASTAR